MSGWKILPEPLTSESYAIAVRKGRYGSPSGY